VTEEVGGSAAESIETERLLAEPEIPPIAATTSAPAITSVDEKAYRFHLGNRPPLTGIRALGMATALIFHSNFQTMPGAWVALQVFFVLSGFLITSMLAEEGKRNGRISLKRFYSRRIVRLGPPLLLAIVLLLIYAAFVFVPGAEERVWEESAAALFYFEDYRVAFGHEPFLGYFAHTWSLSVEEQFYVIWSVLMVVAVTFSRRRRHLAYAFAVIGIVLSTSDRLWLVYRTHVWSDAAFSRAYNAFDSRADALFVGCLLGLLASDGVFHALRTWLAKVLPTAAVASTLLLAWVLFKAPLFSRNVILWWMPFATIATAIIVTYFVMCPSGWGSRLVGCGFLVYVGNLSYTVYIVHFPVYLIFEPGYDQMSFTLTMIVRLSITFSIAVISWHLIERPLARWRQRSAAK
jgi:peptidoglycan/LPS O-acetylase OafA/YrhL